MTTPKRLDMIDIELDGQKVSVEAGSTVMHAAEAAGTLASAW